MARIEDIERRLLNWARWKLGATHSGLGYAAMRWGGGIPTPGNRESVVPTIDCEAEVTDRAVLALAGDLRATIETVYLLNDKPMRWKAAYLCCSEPTVKARVWQAHKKIEQWYSDRSERRREELQRMSRSWAHETTSISAPVTAERARQPLVLSDARHERE